MPVKKPSRNKNKIRTSLFISKDALKAATDKAHGLGISRGQYLDQLVRRDTNLPVGVVFDEPPSVFG
jgi:hypothetical protein